MEMPLRSVFRTFSRETKLCEGLPLHHQLDQGVVCGIDLKADQQLAAWLSLLCGIDQKQLAAQLTLLKEPSL